MDLYFFNTYISSYAHAQFGLSMQLKTLIFYSSINMRQLQSIKPKLDIELFVDLAEFPYSYQFLHDVIIKLFCFDLQNNFMITTCKNWQKQGNSAKSTNNPVSSFGLTEQNLELSHIYQAVLSYFFANVFSRDIYKRFMLS